MNKIFRQTVAGLCSGAVLLTGISVMPYDTANAAGDCIIDTGTTYQTIRWFGGMNLPEWMGSDLTAAQRQTAFGNGENELGLSILRIYISDDSDAWSRAVPTALAAQQNGATVFATPWNPPASMRSAGSGGANGGKYVLNSGSEAQYARTVIEGPIAVSYRLGDLNDDGKINAVDLTLAKRGVIYGSPDKVQQIAADINLDGDVSPTDLIWMIKYLEGIEKNFP